MRAPRKAKAILNRLLQSRQLTPSGLNWLITATDPFHDEVLRPSGYPDLNTTNTLVQTFTKTVTIAAPAYVTTNPWDCQIVFTPLLNGNESVPLSSLYPYTYNGATGVVQPNTFVWGSNLYPGYTVTTGAVGFDLAVTPSVQLGGSTAVVSIPQAMGGEYRLVAAACEVVNTTSELYKGGAVTVWRAPNTQPYTGQVYPGTTTTQTPIYCQIMNSPPTNQALAQLYPTARTWSAQDGAYVIATQVSAENPFRMATPQTPIAIQAPSVSQQIGGGALVPCWTLPNITTSFNNASNATTLQPVPFAFHGALFSGLANQSTLQVTVKYTYERVPSVSEPDFLVLTQPPSDYDALAMEIYMRAICEMPVGVPVSENPLGEWFNDIMDVVGDVAPTIGAFIGGPAGSQLGNAVGNVAKKFGKKKDASQPEVMKQPPAPKMVRPQSVADAIAMGQAQSVNAASPRRTRGGNRPKPKARKKR